MKITKRQLKRIIKIKEEKMKITKRQLRRIIKEEKRSLLQEAQRPYMTLGEAIENLVYFARLSIDPTTGRNVLPLQSWDDKWDIEAAGLESRIRSAIEDSRAEAQNWKSK